MMPKDSLAIFSKGLLMGIADIVPGISGGTIAMITGIYERLVRSISKINFKFIPYLMKGDFKRANKNIRDIDFALFLPLLTGIGMAFLLMSNLILFFLQNFTAITYAFFFGLILSSGVLLYKSSGCLSVKNISFLGVGFFCAFVFVEVTRLGLGHSLPVIFFSGVIAICAMILPGISGSFILLFLNQYEYMLSVLKNLQILEILTFGFGAFIGVCFFSRIVDYILNKYKSVTMFFLIGLMLGALRFPYQKISNNMDSFLPVSVALIAGVLIIFVLSGKQACEKIE